MGLIREDDDDDDEELTNSMELSLSWETSSCLATQIFFVNMVMLGTKKKVKENVWKCLNWKRYIKVNFEIRVYAAYIVGQSSE
jgi:hypothetical protein